MEWDVPEHYLYQSDFNHPGPRGSYLAAATVYSTLFQESSVGVGYDWALNEADAAELREVASTTVMENLELWNITP